ncbi:MAG TPA: DNA polymerase I [Fimbriimonadaceae bacterium]|nr:DNA polymerase I [Fimbriimonadaceae bacterium]HRJ95491.1 DNA polymerase I [Fimbriimonadaceae bacterium]
MDAAKKLVVVDGYSLLYRAFFATRMLSTSDGRPTNALYSFVSMLFLLLEKERPDSIVIAMDAPGKTFRHDKFADYKGTRKETPPELKMQFPVARELVAALHIPLIELPGYEADDIVGTISKQGEQNGYATLIVTGDLDTLQLVDEHVSVMTNKQGVTETKTYDPDEVQKRYGFSPELLPDYKALVGDTSDNIPGVPGIGDKSATLLIQRFGTVEEMLERLDEVEEKFRKKLEPCKEQIPVSKWLATIDRSAPIEFTFEPYFVTKEGLDVTRAVLESLEFKSHVRRLDAIMAAYLEGSDRALPTVEIVAEHLAPSVFPDTVSYQDLLFWVGDGPFAAVEVRSSEQASMFEEDRPWGMVAIGSEVRRAPRELVRRLFAEATDQAILHDSKPWYRALLDEGAARDLPPARFDSLLAGYVLQSGRSGYSLADLAQGYLDFAAPATDEQRAMALFLLEAPMRERLSKEGQTSVLDDIEAPLAPILAEMEHAGIAVEREFLEEFSKSLQVEIDKVQQLIFEMAGEEFLIGSPKQLGDVLFEKMGLPGSKKTKVGWATGAEVLQLLAPGYPICAEVLTWRELTKLKSTYADALPRMIGPDGRIHTTYSQTVAATGRLSSNDPNLQNIPIRTELGRQIRRAFVAPPGHRLASFDYSQIELRILAHLCHDEVLVEAFRAGVDVHAATAGLMFDLPPSSVDSTQRRLAKMLNYAVLYGVTDYGLANQLGGGFSTSEARKLIQQYFERFPSIKAFTEGVIQEARQKGFTTTMSGRRRYFPDIHAANRNERLYAERQAINAPLQGAAADMIKLAMIRVRGLLGKAATRMLLQVHDELLFELTEGEENLVEPIRQAMEKALPLDIPVEVDAKSGLNWDEMAACPRTAVEA